MSYDEAFKSVIISNDAKLTLCKNHLQINQADNIAKLYLKDLSFIILESPQITITSALLSALAKAKITLLSCDESHLPNGIFMPFLTHFQASLTLKEQCKIKAKHKAILWQKIIQNKITNQAFVLQSAGFKKEADTLLEWAKNVALNDGTFMESKAAALHFKTLFGKNFSRDDLCFENSALNYGYAIIRAVIVRAVCISGLCPALGIKHDNAYNGFNLCDDIIEVFRAFVDMKVVLLKKEADSGDFLEKRHKIALIENLQSAVFFEGKNIPLIRAINHFVANFKNALLEDENLGYVGFEK